MPLKHANRFVWFDLIRGLSAFAVCAGHLRAATLANYGSVLHPTVLHKLFYFATSLGHQAVMVFFVLSGFFVGGSVLRNRAEFSWPRYLLLRLTRLWTVLIPALLLTALVDRVVEHHAPGVLAGSRYAVWNSGPASAASFSDSVGTFLGNVAFLQAIRVPVFGTNGPLWSLANEFWYYLLFPALVCALRWPSTRSRRWTRLLCGALGLGLLMFLPGGLLQGFAIWLLGVLVWLTSFVRLPRYRGLFAAVSTLIFLLALFYSSAPGLQDRLKVPSDLVVGLGFAFLAMGIIQNPLPSWTPEWFVQLTRAVSEFSYSLYAVHFPIMLLIAVMFYSSDKVQPTAPALIQFVGWFSVLVAAGFAFWWMFEKRTDRLRRFVQSAFGTKAVDAAS